MKQVYYRNLPAKEPCFGSSTVLKLLILLFLFITNSTFSQAVPSKLFAIGHASVCFILFLI
jgi:hypothetical protein